MTSSRINRSHHGFTLIELVVVIAIIVLVAAGAVKIGASVKVKAEIRNSDKATIRLLVAAMQEYYDYTKSFSRQQYLRYKFRSERQLQCRGISLILTV